MTVNSNDVLCNVTLESFYCTTYVAVTIKLIIAGNLLFLCPRTGVHALSPSSKTALLFFVMFVYVYVYKGGKNEFVFVK